MNIIDAIINLVTNPVTRLVEYYQGRNRANNAGDSLEEYVKDLFAGTFDTPAEERLRIHNEVFRISETTATRLTPCLKTAMPLK